MLPRIAAVVVLVVAPCSIASAQDLSGKYDLRGSYDDGRATTAAVDVKRVAGGKLLVERKGTASGKTFLWSAQASQAPGSRALSVTFRVPVTTSFVGALGGATASQNELTATYTLSPDGLRLGESVTNVTRLKPEEGWKGLTTAGGRRVAGLTLGELAELSVPSAFDDLVLSLAAFGPTTLPHEAKNLRKQIVGVRDLIDLFSYAYPKGDGQDTWKEVRELLDEGYESMGTFKDLFDIQGVADPKAAVYDMAEVKTRREPVLDWKRRFTKSSRLALFSSYLAHPKKSLLTDRKAKDLSPFYWGEAGIEPRNGLDGIDNLARLERVLLEAAAKDLEKTAELRKLHVEDNAVSFHDFRKRLRSATKLAAAFPQVFEKDEDPTKTLAFLNEVVTRYGEVNDKIVEHARAEEKGDKSKADKLEKTIKKLWEDLRDWQEDEKTDAAIGKLRKMVR